MHNNRQLHWLISATIALASAIVILAPGSMRPGAEAASTAPRTGEAAAEQPRPGGIDAALSADVGSAQQVTGSATLQTATRWIKVSTEINPTNQPTSYPPGTGSATGGVFGTGAIAWIPFHAVGSPGNRTVLSVTVSSINQPDGTVPAIDRIDGMVIITDVGGGALGDCDGDGAATEFDARCALEISVDLRPVISVLDLDADNSVTSRDATLILQRATGRT